MTKEDEIRKLIAKLRVAYESGDNIEIESAINELEDAVKPPEDSPPESQPDNA